jgi:acyl-CoA reductase-like NAD-dependent aldehyde dehydrogenase
LIKFGEAPEGKLISSTGGAAAGRAVAHAAAEKLIAVVLELGGKSPNIVFAERRTSDPRNSDS